MMHLTLVGLSYRTAPIAVRERLAFPDSGVAEALRALQDDFHFEEGLILSTCNRVEVLGRSESAAPRPDRLKAFLSQFHRLELESFAPYLYEFRQRPLIEHVFRVASSLDSMVVGEAQILGQIKRAYGAACEAGTAGSRLNGLMSHAFFTAKRVRAETRIGHAAVSVSSVAVDLARRIFNDLGGKTVLLLGAGEMGELAARSLVSAGSRLLVANRTAERARAIAASLGGASMPYSELDRCLPTADIVLVSTGADSFVITPQQVRAALRERKHHPCFIIDISVPRNVDPSVNRIDGAFLYDIDDLQSVVESNRRERLHEAEHAETIISEEVGRLLESDRQCELGGRIADLRQRIERLCLAELEAQRNEVDAEEYERLRRALLRSAHQIAHPLIVELKKREIPEDELLERLNTVIPKAGSE